MTITPPSLIPYSVDYTGRDYYSIREQLIARVQNRLTNWTGSDPADFGVALLEAFAYLGDLMSYYIDRNANEAFISTATQLDSVYNLARTYGYTPAGYRSASVTLHFQNTSSSPISIPAGTVVYGDVTSGDITQQVYFTTQTTVVADPAVNSGAVDVLAKEGQSVSLVSPYADSYGELVGASNGQPNQVFQLLETPVVDGSVTVYVQDGSNYSSWNYINNLVDAGSSQQVFTTFLDSQNSTYIQFGNGVTGLIPVNLANIKVQYTVGGGVVGNVLSQAINTINYVPGLTPTQFSAFVANMTVTNLNPATGGSDPEAIDVVRYLAPLYLRTNTRAINLSDFGYLALALAGKAKAVSGTNWSSVTLYTSPRKNPSDTDIRPSYVDEAEITTSQEFNDLSAALTTYITPRMMAGATLTIQPPTYVDVIVSVQYTPNSQYTTTQIETAIYSTILNTYSYFNNQFAQVIYPQDIEFVLNNLPQVKIAKVTALYRQGGSGLNVLTGAANELFRFQQANIGIGTI